MIQMPTEAEPVVVIEADCLDVLPTLADGSVDAVVTDPPYNVGFEYEGDESGDRKENYGEWCAEWLSELKRACSGPILISCGIVNLGTWHQIEKPRWVMCWHKPATMGRAPIGFNNWEPVLVYGQLLKNVCDVFQAVIKPDRALDGHPCPKPLAWAKKQIQSMPSADLILDPFAGSGTTGVAAIATGRRAILIEKDPRYAEICRRRIAESMGRGKGSLFRGMV